VLVVDANVLLHAVNERARAGRHLPLLRGLLELAGTRGNLVGDPHLAALALEHGATVVSFDRDFARFDGLGLLRPG
jgi:predicted nucleic acid-binding protein